MKKLGFLALCCLMSVVSAAQSLHAFDLKGSYGTGTERCGIGAGITLGVIENLELSPSFNYYFEKDNITLFDVDADFHYNLKLDDSWVVYPLLGATYYNIRFENDGYKEIEGKFGMNVGGGIGLYLAKDLLVKAEVKYQKVQKPEKKLNDLLFHYKDQVKFSLGVAYAF